MKIQRKEICSVKKLVRQEFPGSPVVSTGHLNRVGIGSIPGPGTKIPQAAQPKKKKKKNDANNHRW